MSSPEAEKDDDDTSSSSWYIQANIVTNITKDFKKTKKAFTHLQQLQESESNISDDDDEDDASHFQIAGSWFQFTQLNQELEPRIVKLFNQAQEVNNNLDLREIIILDSHSTMDLFLQPGTGRRDI